MDHLHNTAAPAAVINRTCVDCGEPPNARGLKRDRCSRCYPKHWRALKTSGVFVDLRVRPLKDRLLGKTAPGYGGCVIYTGGVDRGGYGVIHHEGKSLIAHRMAYGLLVGPVPDGLQLDHLCHTRDLSCQGGAGCLHRRCINPHHLEPVTHAENTRRGRSPHSLKTHCPQGHAYTPENTYWHKNSRKCRKCAHAAWLKNVSGYNEARRTRRAEARALIVPCGYVSRRGNACARPMGHEGQHQSAEAVLRVRQGGAAR